MTESPKFGPVLLLISCYIFFLFQLGFSSLWLEKLLAKDVGKRYFLFLVDT